MAALHQVSELALLWIARHPSDVAGHGAGPGLGLDALEKLHKVDESSWRAGGKIQMRVNVMTRSRGAPRFAIVQRRRTAGLCDAATAAIVDVPAATGSSGVAGQRATSWLIRPGSGGGALSRGDSAMCEAIRSQRLRSSSTRPDRAARFVAGLAPGDRETCTPDPSDYPSLSRP